MLTEISRLLSLRSPQHGSLRLLGRLMDGMPPNGWRSSADALSAVQDVVPGFTSFDHSFPSVCFALATGVGKTRLMGACIAYMHLSRRSRNFLALAPGTTVYDKLIQDFTPGTPKYVFRGIQEFAVNPPLLVTGDNWDEGRAASTGDFFDKVVINIFNVGKLDRTVGRIRRDNENVGGSYFAHLAGLQDLVVLMDEAHRYRAAAGMRAIAELEPMLGLEFTATPRVSARGGARFGNVIYEYGLGDAIDDGLVKRPAVATRANFDPAGVPEERLEEIKLQDGMRAHENTRLELAAYARVNGLREVHPFVLVVARDVAHAKRIRSLIESPAFMEGRYLGKVTEVHSALGGEESEASAKRLLELETDTVTDVVVHVNKLKEGWDVTNLYTIIPLRASAAEILTEQTLGRGLRLPYGRRTGNDAVDALTVIAHDQFDAIIRQAQQPGSIMMRSLTIGDGGDVPARPGVLMDVRPQFEDAAIDAAAAASPTPAMPAARAAAAASLRAIRGLTALPTLASLTTPGVRDEIVRMVTAELAQADPGGPPPDRADIEPVVAELTSRIVENAIDIPQITVLPDEETNYAFVPFAMEDEGWLASKRPVRDELLLQDLLSEQRRVLRLDQEGRLEGGPASHLARLLAEFDDVDYAACAPLLHDLAAQAARVLLEAWGEEDADNVATAHGPDIAEWLHRQMERHCVETEATYSAHVAAGLRAIQPIPLRMTGEACDVRRPVIPLADTRRRVFAGFRRCVYPMQVFQSDEERQFAALVDLHEEQVMRWMKPATGQFRIPFGPGRTYEPDFVVETTEEMLIVEIKAARDMEMPEVRAKAAAAMAWTGHANAHAAKHAGKPWSYVLVPHDRVGTNSTLSGLVSAFGSRPGAAGGKAQAASKHQAA